ncbi:hypothetical protein [Brevundimonas sp.]|jgi:hypothetical protein|uniref:hypothetical protein n=1 Tax=Brevundimonas sp. TaxID=1871086 RepID=UPI00391B26B9|nr:hypothetical protein [Brevundimonas sp.]
MKRLWATAAFAAVITAVAACKGGDTAAPVAEPAPPASTARTETAPAPARAPTTETQPIVAGAPDFAALYPGATLQGDPIVAAGPDGPGGLATYLTNADPEAVIEFHRSQAERAGLSSVMAMNQGDARAYGAAKAQSSLQVVAAPTPDGMTSVQLSWSAGG